MLESERNKLLKVLRHSNHKTKGSSSRHAKLKLSGFPFELKMKFKFSFVEFLFSEYNEVTFRTRQKPEIQIPLQPLRPYIIIDP